MKTKLLLGFIILIFLGFSSGLKSTDIQSARQNLINSQQSYFTENIGQWGETIKYAANLKNVNVVVSGNSIYYDFYQVERIDKNSIRQKGNVIEMSFAGASNNIKIKEMPSISENPVKNYFIGNSASKWATGANTCKTVEFEGIYPNTNLNLYIDNGFPRYDFILKPGANPEQIVVNFKGFKNIEMKEDGALIQSEYGEIYNGKLLAYQEINGEKNKIVCSFEKKNGGIGFKVGDYDRNLPLVIDPLIYTSYLGGSFDEEITGIQSVDSSSYVVAGWTESPGFRVTSGAYDTTYEHYKDGFISKFKISGASTQLLFSTFIGAYDNDIINDCAVDLEGNIFIVGATNSIDFPAISAFEITYNAGYEAFITKLNPAGNKLLFSGFLNGSDNDYATCLALDMYNNAYIAGYTDSKDFYVKNPYQAKLKGSIDIFVAKVLANGSSLSFSTFLGGDSDDIPYDIDLDLKDNIYLTGETVSANFPVWPWRTGGWGGGWILEKPYDHIHNGGKDAFAVSMSGSGNMLNYSGFYGGKGDDIGRAVVGDEDGSIYFSGDTYEYTISESEFPITANAYANTHKGGWDGFIAKIEYPKKQGTWDKSQALLFSTYFGDKNDDFVKKMDLSVSPESIIIVGNTKSPKFPIIDSYGVKFKGGIDSYLAYFTGDASDLYKSTMTGDLNDDVINCFAFDKRKDVYCGGYTTSKSMAMVEFAEQGQFGGGTKDGFITKFSLGSIELAPFTDDEFCAGSNFKIDWITDDMTPNDSYAIDYYDPFDGKWINVAPNVKGVTYNWAVPVNLTEGDGYKLRISHISGLNSVSNSEFSIISPPPAPVIKASSENEIIQPPQSAEEPYIIHICDGKDLKINSTKIGKDVKLQWYFKNKAIANAKDTVYTIPAVKKDNAGIYHITASNGCAPDANSINLILIVDTLATVTKEPQNKHVTETDSVEFKIEAYGTDIKYQWQKDGDDIFGENLNIYKIKSTNKTNEGLYRCVVEGKCSSDTSLAAELVVDTINSVFDNNVLYNSGKLLIKFIALDNNSMKFNLTSQLNCYCKISLSDNFGREIYVIYNGQVNPGEHEYLSSISGLPSGIYWLRAEACNNASVKKLLIAR